MRFCVLGSGSKGNSVFVESGNTRILIDAGFSGVEIKRRLESIGQDVDGLAALLVTHEHRDHVGGAGILSRRCKLPVYANASTHRAAEHIVGDLPASYEFNTGEPFVLSGLEIHPFRISHDTADPVGFIISDGTYMLGFCTDTGKVTSLIRHHLARCHGMVLEANHDPLMLQNGPYPQQLKQRVRSNQGHLANDDAGQLLRELAGGPLRHVVLAHLSNTNNLPNLVKETVCGQLAQVANNIIISLAEQERAGPIISLDNTDQNVYSNNT